MPSSQIIGNQSSWNQVHNSTVNLMNLEAALNVFRAEFLEKFPAKKAAIMQQATDTLVRGFKDKPLLQVGDLAPDFTLANAIGTPVRLSDRLSQAPVILTFYRGGWCPYCNLELRAYQQVLPQIQAAGATLIAVSPQTSDASLSTVEKNNLSFEVLSDIGSTVADAYGIAFELPNELKALYTELGHPLPGYNGTNDWKLPVPATFVIDPQRRILLAHIDVDYRNRLEPTEAIRAIAQTTTARV
ncbi:MAG: AhpC/TSA family protein [Stenomitos rutilans HA7619-LM2]|nr:AhpC/TSA family protein [Stenomitos rutilans HA7619-LM2]